MASIESPRLSKVTATNELTFESLAKRIESLERKLAEREAPQQDWRRSYGMFSGSEFMKQVDEEVLAMRAAERQAARAGLF